VDGTAIRERLQILRLEVAKIWEENRRYLEKNRHNYAEEQLHKDRETRLVRILEELTGLTKKNPS